MPEEELIKCDICEKQVSEDEVETCACGRVACLDCSSYGREWDTGAAYFQRCLTCDEALGEAERKADYN